MRRAVGGSQSRDTEVGCKRAVDEELRRAAAHEHEIQWCGGSQARDAAVVLVRRAAAQAVDGSSG